MKRSSILRGAVLLAAVALTPASAFSTTFTHVTFTDTTTSQTGPESSFAKHGFVFLFGLVATGDVDGDLTGTIVTRGNAILNTQTNETILYGTFTIETADVTWEGPFKGKVNSSGVANGSFLGQGTDGTALIGTFEQISLQPPVFLDEAVIVDYDD